MFHNVAPYGDGVTEMVHDEEMNARVVQLIGEGSSLEMPCKSPLRYLVFHLKNLNKFICLEMLVKCSDGKKRKIICSNQQSISRITKNGVSMPLELQSKGWNHLCLDLENIIATAFGVQYKSCFRVTIYSTCRVWKCFFQDKKYCDVELPDHLRVSPKVE